MYQLLEQCITSKETISYIFNIIVHDFKQDSKD